MLTIICRNQHTRRVLGRRVCWYAQLATAICNTAHKSAYFFELASVGQHALNPCPHPSPDRRGHGLRLPELWSTYCPSHPIANKEILESFDSDATRITHGTRMRLESSFLSPFTRMRLGSPTVAVQVGLTRCVCNGSARRVSPPDGCGGRKPRYACVGPGRAPGSSPQQPAGPGPLVSVVGRVRSGSALEWSRIDSDTPCWTESQSTVGLAAGGSSSAPTRKSPMDRIASR